MPSRPGRHGRAGTIRDQTIRCVLPVMLFITTGSVVPTNFEDRLVAQGLGSDATAFSFLPDGRAIVTTKTGVIYLQTGDTMAVVPNLHTLGEAGLLGVAVDGNDVYTIHNRDSPREMVISRWQMSGGNLTDRTDYRLFPDLSAYHNGGCLRIADGNLYASLGDDAMPCQAQDPDSLRGKVVAMDLSTSLFSVVCRGLRNPFRFWPDDGRLWIGDVGGDLREEIDVAEGGENFGWPKWEGHDLLFQCGTLVDSTLDFALVEYPHSDPAGASVVGGPVYRATFEPDRFPPEYEGAYFYGEFMQGWIRCRGVTASGQPDSVNWATGIGLGRLVDLQTGPDGALWYLKYNGELRRIVYTGPSSAAPARGAGGHELAVSQNPFRGGTLEIAGAVDPVNVWDVAGRLITVVHDGRWSHPSAKGIYFLSDGRSRAKVVVE